MHEVATTSAPREEKPPARRVLGPRRMHLRFDRGTLLSNDPAPGLTWDPRVGAHRAPAFRYAELGGDSAGVYVPAGDVAPWSAIELRAYQEAALDAWELAGRRGLVALPTGSGKTRVALAAMARTRATALVVVPTRVLLEQWLAAVRQVYGGAAGIYGDGERSLAAVTVATYESAQRHVAAIGNRFELLVIDEAHHFGAGARDELLEMCTAPMRLGLSGTPAAGAAGVVAARLIGPTVYELGVGDLAGSYLADYDVVTLLLDLEADERADYDAYVAQYQPIVRAYFDRTPLASWADFARTAMRSESGRTALAAWRQARRMLGLTAAKCAAIGRLIERHQRARLLIFTPDNESTYAIARRHLVMPMTCDIARAERQAALERFRTGEIRVLVSAQVLNEGLDVPDAGVGIVVGGSRGNREHVQRVGRLLRPAPGKRALVYELVTRSTFEVRQAQRRRGALVAQPTT